MPAFALAASMAVLLPRAVAGPYDAAASVSPGQPPAVTAAATTVDATVASHSARAGELIGPNCSYTTGMMARRVIEEGADWSYVGHLEPSDNNLVSMVAAPFAIDGTTYVIANELVEMLAGEGHTGARLSLIGKLLEVDGVRYVVLTSFKVLNS